MNKGIFELKTAKQLFKKLEADYVLFKENPEDTYLAFNFFITAEHLPDWIGNKDIRKSTSDLIICSHLANGAKHFTTNRHNAITKTEKERYVKLDYVEEGYVSEPLIIYLTDGTSSENHESINAIKLAEKIYTFWKEYFLSRHS